MNKKSLLYFLDSQKHPALIAGIAIAIIHFVITSILDTPSDLSFAGATWLTLTAPTFMLDNLGDKIKFLRLVANFFNSSNDLLFTLFSSLVYGITGGFLMSKKKYMQLTGIVLVCIFILTSINLCFLAAFVQG